MRNLKPHERIILPLDVSNTEKALQLVDELLPYVGFFKVGFEALYSILADLALSSETDADNYLRAFRRLLSVIGKNRLFLDVKICDIPNTVGNAAKAIARFEPAIFNLHASVGEKAIKTAVANKGRSKLFGVTILTSIESEECRSIFGNYPDSKVFQFAKILCDLGADGIICAPKEGEQLKLLPMFKDMEIACPNVRPLWAVRKDDQNKDRQMTPYEAIKAQIDYLVIGRPITNPPSKIGGSVDAAVRIAEEIASVS